MERSWPSAISTATRIRTGPYAPGTPSSPPTPYREAARRLRDIEDVRRAIDTLDRKTVRLIGRRAGYVRAAARFKTGEANVRAPERQRTMLEERRRWAEEEDLSPEVIEQVYKHPVSYFVDRELGDWRGSG